jgi:hypothetical protein
MYRLTISGTLAEKAKSTFNDTQTIWIRMYRWENKWGEYVIATNQWSCEKRTHMAYFLESESDNQAVLEKVEAIDLYSPPYEVDDMWEEEVLTNGNMTCGNIFVVKGTSAEIHAVCAELFPSCTKWLSEHLKYVKGDEPKRYATHTHTTVSRPPYQQNRNGFRNASGSSFAQTMNIRQKNEYRRPVCLIETD